MDTELNKSRLFTKDYISIILVVLLISIVMNMTMATLPIYGKQIGGSNVLAGFITATFTLSALFFRPLFGNLLDRKGRKKILLIGIFIFALSVLSYIFAYTIIILLFFRFMQGIGFSGHSTGSGTIVADIVPTDRMGEGIGYFGIANIIGSAIGPTIGLYIINYFHYQYLFIFSGILSVSALLIAFIINYEKNKEKEFIDYPNKNTEDLIEDTELTDKISLDKQSFIEKTALPSSIILIFIALTYGSIITFISIYARNKGIENIGIFFVCYAVALLLTRVNMGKIIDKYGINNVMIPGLILLFLSLILLAFAESLITFLITAFLYGFGYGVVFPTLNTVMVKVCPPSRRGAGNATFFSAMDIGVGFGSVLWGFISDVFGFAYVYITASLSIILALILYLYFYKGKKIS